MSPINIKMMASSIINSIPSDRERSVYHMALKVFVVCARKLGNDAQLRFYDGKVCTLASLFQKILDALSRNPPLYNNLKILYKEIGGWYNTFFVSLPQPTFDEVSDIIDSVLEHLYFIFRDNSYYSRVTGNELSRQPIGALIEKITFLRNFILFATLRSVEPPQLLGNLLAHIQAVAVDAAHTSYIYSFHDEYGVEPNIQVLLQMMINMVDSQVDETYTQVLTSSKLSTRLHSPIPDKDHDPLVVMKDFINSLLSNLCERLQTDTHIVIPTNSVLQLVEEGLRLMSIMLQAQPNIFDKKIGELSRVVICDAGILIFSLYQRDMELAVPTSGLLQRINRITQIVKGKDFSIPDLLQRISRFRRLSDINMMASLVLNSIRSALKAPVRPGNNMLESLEVFVVCARKLGNDAQLRFYDGKVTTLASLFQKILDALSRYPPPYSTYYLITAIDNFSEEIRGWYSTLLVSLPQPTLDEVTDFIDSILEILNDRRDPYHHYYSEPDQTIEALIKKIRFLRNFIRFATLRRVEPPQLLDNLLAHIHAVAVDAAHTSWFYISRDYGVKGEYGVVPNIPVLLQMIKMVDPQVDETYTQALTSSKLSTRLLFPIPDKDHDPLVVIMKDFIDSLLSNICERRQTDTPIVIPTNSELQLVEEGLRLLSIMLQAQPNIFDKKFGELTRVVICDAGILIFSLYQRDMEMAVPDSGLLQRINRITQIVKGKDFSIPDLLQRISRFRRLSDVNMMASVVLDSISSALGRLSRRDNDYTYFMTQWKLKNLEMFVVCARKLGNDAQLRFDDGKVTAIASLFQRICLALSRDPLSPRWVSPENLRRFIDNFKEEIGGWYNTLLVSLPQPTFDEVTHFIHSVSMRLYGLVRDIDLHYREISHRRTHYYWPSMQPMEALTEMITFLRNLIRFATLWSVESPQLLAHIQAVVVDAAHTSFIFSFYGEYGVGPNIPVFLQMMKMVDPQVDETCTQALTSSKLLTHLIMKDFIDSLLWYLRERLHVDTPIVISTNSELQLVYEGLRLLRIMLEEQPKKFDKKIEELTRVMICDAGIIIFSLHRREMEKDVPTSGLLQRINRITQIVRGKDLSIPDLLQGISRIRQRVEGKDLSIPDLLQRLHGSREQVGVNYLNSKIPPATDIKVKKVSMPPNPVPIQNRVPVGDEIVGFGDDITSITKRLTRGSKKLKMVAIVGMPGVGKTTLATKVLNHPSVTCRFQVRLWCCVSQLFHKKNLLLELLSLVDPDTTRSIEKSEQDLSEDTSRNIEKSEQDLSEDTNRNIEKSEQDLSADTNRNIEKSEHELTQKLWRHLREKRYLIFLDDVWDIEAWDSLKASFPDDSYGSRILVTSRHRDAVLPDEEPHFLNPLTDDQSWELLQKKLSPRNHWSESLSKIGRKIAANCKGLPLALVVTAGLLVNMEPEDWWNILEDLTVVANAEPCMNTFESSYKHLPGQLKECFLYFGLFPEDREVSVKRLIRLWIAEGFVRKTESKSLEDVARDYILELARRSLVIVSKERSGGGVKACRIHDLLHDFCRTKAKEENFFQLLKGFDELLFFEKSGYMRRLCVYSEVKYFKSLNPFCPRLHSLLFFNHDVQREGEFDISFIFRRYSSLRVLDTNSVSLSFGIPSEMKYLSLTGVTGDIRDIILSIGNLANLESFILHSSEKKVSLPDTFWNLRKLRHVDIKWGFHLSFENLERFPDLCELQSCSNAIIRRGKSIEKLVRKFPNIRKLRCSREDSDNSEILTLDSLRQLESLDLTSDGRLQFVFPDNLRKLSLSKVFLQQSDVSRIGELPNLEVLKFRGVSFKKNTWAMEEGEFSSLRFLELNFSSIVRWTASDDQFPCLEKLILRDCYHLEEIPCCFESINTLEIVDVKYCCDSVNSFFKGIEDEQMKSGNSWTKIQIQYFRRKAIS